MQCSILAKNSSQLKAAIRRIEQNYQMYRANMDKLNRVSNKFNGLKRAVEIVEATR
jgi:prefoldin subunit 5